MSVCKEVRHPEKHERDILNLIQDRIYCLRVYTLFSPPAGGPPDPEASGFQDD